MSIDTIGDFLTIIRNGIMSSKSFVLAPHSTLKLELASILKEEGFIKQKYKLKYGLDYFYFLIWNIMAPKIFHSLPYSIKYLIVSITKFDKKKPKAYHTN